MPSYRTSLLLWTGMALALPIGSWAGEAASRCAAQSAARVPLVVELYTSEGCSSCPPADRWLSGLKGRSEVVALSFHVDYWDRLGWKDRFSSATYSQRQTQLLRTSGARFLYTPQVVVDGHDQPRWSGMPLPALRPLASVQATLAREGDNYRAELRLLPGAPPRIAGFWAVTEDGHASAVKSGENRGATLGHDFVVREYEAIVAWDARDTTPSRLRLQFSPSQPIDPSHPRRLNLVLVDADSGRVLQAMALDC
jgi:hypothetical protein